MESDKPEEGWDPYELLASYLEPQFGDIYEKSDTGEIQGWSEELREAVIHYLEYELPGDVAAVLFEHDPGALEDPKIKRAAIDDVIKSSQPWDVALDVACDAIRAVPTLDQLIGHLDTWPSENERWHADVWLEGHDTDYELSDLAKQLDLAARGRTAYDLTHDYEPQELLKAWHDAVGPASSDLTDDEWQLLNQALPPDTPGMVKERGIASTRREVNGMLYRLAHQTKWDQVPRRYGNASSIQFRASIYKKKGVYARTLAALDGQPGAERLVEWLWHVEGGRPTTSDQRDDSAA
ncbi:transposase [Streptomyces sp. NPDC048504]|uniref:transposase n=1 Tax=Streptomyces sp. NPDC048504 TaxID=3365559 RepID=UPI0037114CB2